VKNVFEVIKAKVPLAEMNKYSTALSSITGGRANVFHEVCRICTGPGRCTGSGYSKHTPRKKRKNREFVLYIVYIIKPPQQWGGFFVNQRIFTVP